MHGVVQGVGFRPFVYRIATEAGLAGCIGNDTSGVTIEAEGAPEQMDVFLRRLGSEAPPMSRIDAIEVRDVLPIGESAFRIVTSQVRGHVSTGIPADTATCPDCLRELLDPVDRRYRYAFLNCTNCGPRFTITRSIPYDRPQTSMAVFPMCARCQAEYDDPLNRRFHAQPNACWDCGPKLWLSDPDGSEIETSDPVRGCVDRLMGGGIVAIKGIGGFHLCVDATREDAVLRLRERKRRLGKPLAVMVKDVEVARQLCAITAGDEALLMHPARPIVLVRARKANSIAASVAPGTPWLGVFVPYAPLQHLLFADDRVRALVMTSANLSEEPIAIDNEEARVRLHGIADCFLLHNREILQRCDDSVMARVDGGPQILRRARGCVPLSVELPFEARPLLAVGGNLKSVFTLARGRKAFQSQHLGDLESLSALEFFEEALTHLKRTFDIEPQTVVHDLHPGYMSTVWAKRHVEERGLQAIGVQHHHAHIAACMAEHGVDGPVIGLSLDGTGYGTDGRIWGGEVLIAHYRSFERFAHFANVPMPGGDAAVREPWRMAVAHLHAAGLDVLDTPILRKLGVKESDVRVLLRMIERGLNAPWTSSLGRLFDAAGALILGRREVDYEAQAAIELEGACVDIHPSGKLYRMELARGDWAKREPTQIVSAPIWKEVLNDLERSEDRAAMAAKFHEGVAEVLIRVAQAARTATQIETVAMSGGVLHNRRLTERLRPGLQAEGFRVLQQRAISPGDGGLSYGQAAVAAAILLGA